MKQKGWRKESYRHSMAAKGVQTKEEIQTKMATLKAQQNKLNEELADIEEREERISLPEQVEESYQDWVEDWTQGDGLMEFPLTNDEYEDIINQLDEYSMLSVFYGNSFDEFVYDNPFVSEFFRDNFDIVTMEEYAPSMIDSIRRENPNVSDDELMDYVTDELIEEYLLNDYYGRDIYSLLSDNPGIWEQMSSHWIDNKLYEKDLRQYAVDNKLRQLKLTEKDMKPKDQKIFWQYALNENHTTDKELEEIRTERANSDGHGYGCPCSMCNPYANI